MHFLWNCHPFAVFIAELVALIINYRGANETLLIGLETPIPLNKFAQILIILHSKVVPHGGNRGAVHALLAGADL